MNFKMQVYFVHGLTARVGHSLQGGCVAGIYRNKDEFVVCTGIGWGLDRERERERGVQSLVTLWVLLFLVCLMGNQPS